MGDTMADIIEVWNIINTAKEYYSNNKIVQEWVKRNKLDLVKNIQILYNMSQHPVLAKWYCFATQEVTKHVIVNQLEAIYQARYHTDKLLIHFFELDIYGIFTPKELKKFVNGMLTNVEFNYDDKNNFKCTINQVVLDYQQQKLVFNYKNEDTLSELITSIKRVGYDAYVTDIDNKYEITIQKLNADKKETTDLYNNMLANMRHDIAANMKEKRTSICSKYINNRLISFNNANTSIKLKDISTDDVVRLSKTLLCDTPAINYPQPMSDKQQDANVTLTRVELKQQDAAAWIKANPPNNREKTSNYYARYASTKSKYQCAQNIFGKVMADIGYIADRSNGSRYWSKEINIINSRKINTKKPILIDLTTPEETDVKITEPAPKPRVDNKIYTVVKELPKKIANTCANKLKDILPRPQINPFNNSTYINVIINKTEAKLYHIMLKYYEIKRQFRPTWSVNPKTNRCLPFDYVIENAKIIIELDGDQHFIQVRNWQDPNVTRATDVFKTKLANLQGYSVIRLLQRDVWMDKNNWLTKLHNGIKSIQTSADTKNIFISCKDEYYNHINELKSITD
jgi:hypothetical protein